MKVSSFSLHSVDAICMLYLLGLLLIMNGLVYRKEHRSKYLQD